MKDTYTTNIYYRGKLLPLWKAIRWSARDEAKRLPWFDRLSKLRGAEASRLSMTLLKVALHEALKMAESSGGELRMTVDYRRDLLTTEVYRPEQGKRQGK